VDDTEKQFEHIWEDAISKARKVPCSMDEFIDGLSSGIETLKEELDAAHESRNYSD